jgi:hypothetical protein
MQRQNHQLGLRVRHRSETKLSVECLGVGVQGMSRQGTKSGVPREIGDTQQRILKKPPPEASAAMVRRDCELSEQHQRNRIWCVATQIAGKADPWGGGGGQGIESNDPTALRRYEGAGVASFLVPESTSAEPSIKGRFSTKELRNLVRGSKGLNVV